MAAAESEAFYPSLSSSPRLIGHFESESNFKSLFMVHSGCDYEHICEMSFSFWPPGVPLPGAIKDLVNAGFHYTGDGEIVACYSCKVKVQSWEEGADPLDVHRRLSPNCRHLYMLREKTSNERANRRRKSPKANRQNAAIHNSSYLYSSCQTPSSSSLSSSQQSTSFNTSVDNCQNMVDAQAEQETRRLLLQGSQSDKKSDANDLKQPETRLQTFSASCPKEVLQLKLSLADAGFYYTGRNDVVKCAFCNGELHIAKFGSNPPWKSHVNFFPACSFAKTHCESMTNQASETELPERSGEHIVKPAKNQISKFSNDHLFRLKVENEKLRTSVTCVQCRSAQIQILMLPCCHICCCEACAEVLDDCPQCTARILGTVKIFMS